MRSSLKTKRYNSNWCFSHLKEYFNFYRYDIWCKKWKKKKLIR